VLSIKDVIVISVLCILCQSPFFIAGLYFLKRYIAVEKQYNQEEGQLEKAHYNDGVPADVRKKFKRRYFWAVLKPSVGMIFSQFMVGFVALIFVIWVIAKLIPAK